MQKCSKTLSLSKAAVLNLHKFSEFKMTEHIVKVLQRTQLSHSQSDVKHFIYMHSKWLEDATELTLLLTTSNTCYKATLKHDEIRSAAEELEQPYDEFYAECKKALTTQMGLPGFDYELDEQLTQFKLYKCTGFETLYVEVPLRKANNFYGLLDAAIENKQQQPTTSAAAVSERNVSQSQPNELLAEYEKYVKDSKLAERKLLKKFYLLINSKKERIGELERQLEQSQKRTRADTDSDMEDEPEPQAEDRQEPQAEENDDDDDDEAYGFATQPLTQKDAMQT